MRITARQPIVLFTIVVFLFSCRHTSEMQHPLGTDATWSAGDSLTFYFPQNQRVDLGFQYTRSAAIVFNQTTRLTTLEWTGFEQLLRKAGFWTRPANSDDRGMDGSEWVIESLQKDSYRFVARWSPTGAFRDAGVYLINLSGLKVEIY